MSKLLLFVVLAIFFAHSALAQQFYKWKDEKGQWHYSDFPPSGVTAEKLVIGDTAQESASQPSVASAGEQRKTEDSSGRSTQGASDVDLLRPASRRLLVFPPSDPSRPLSEWIPVDSFDSVKECIRARALQIAGTERADFVDFRRLNSRCISLAEFKPSREANVIVAATSVGSDPGGFSTWVVYGRVFNGGQTTAQRVVVRYRVRDARGIIYANGEIPTAPQDISPLMFAEFRAQILGSVGGSDRWVETEAKWSKN
ncbi:MAG TPA: DUF4124 domain-containing protein [Candidatus Binatia bacterium]|nr:DUF4124 domain-containing protein [Candidatus Binatia bacterium]